MSRITIFGRKGCGYCQLAKQLCDIKGLEYRYIDIEEEGISKADLEKTVGKPVLTVPQIFRAQEYVGGFDDLNSLLSSQANR